MVVRAKRLDVLWKRAVMEVKVKGERVERERGPVKELRGLIAHLEPRDEDAFDLPEEYPLDEGAVREYEDQLLDPDRGGFEYTYGNRIREYFGVDQLEGLVERLKEAPETRRAVAVTWDPKRDGKAEEVPCLVAVHLQSDGDDGLELHAFYRSWDVGKALVANVIALRRLQEEVAGEIGAEPTTVTVYASNAHVYLEDLKDLKW